MFNILLLYRLRGINILWLRIFWENFEKIVTYRLQSRGERSGDFCRLRSKRFMGRIQSLEKSNLYKTKHTTFFSSPFEKHRFYQLDNSILIDNLYFNKDFRKLIFMSNLLELVESMYVLPFQWNFIKFHSFLLFSFCLTLSHWNLYKCYVLDTFGIAKTNSYK